MIVVIADDLSGAAELAGAALHHGLRTEVQTAFFPGTNAEVVCVDTGTRLLSPEQAAQRVTAVARSVMAAEPSWIFKKCDSVLRGPVLAEARAVACVAGTPRILLLPANPSRGRTIRSGHYFIAGRPLDQTSFATDPTHPRVTAAVSELLDGDLANISVPDIGTESDVRRQVAILDGQTLPVGAVDFFSALLEARVARRPVEHSPLPTGGKTLLACGSAAMWLERHAEARARGIPSFSLPHDLEAATRALRTGGSILIGIGDGPFLDRPTPASLTRQLAEAVAAILGQTRVERLLLEGGATSAAVIGALGWTRLRAEQIAGAGVGVLRPIADQPPLLFIKPGSYAWPPGIWP